MADESFDNDILDGLLRRFEDIDIVRVQDVGLRTKLDPPILACAADDGRVLLTHDISTVPDFAYERAAGLPMPSVFIVADTPPCGDRDRTCRRSQ